MGGIVVSENRLGDNALLCINLTSKSVTQLSLLDKASCIKVTLIFKNFCLGAR